MNVNYSSHLTACCSRQTLLKLAENILEHPDEEKYQKFKTTNPTIKKLLVDPKGTLEYARAVRFARFIVAAFIDES